MKNILKKERGSITLFVLVSMLFMTMFLATIYTLATNNEIAGRESTRKIKEIYEVGLNRIDEIYMDLKEKMPLPELVYEYDTTNYTAKVINDDSYANTLVGSIAIPNQVVNEEDGKTYTVTSIGNSAFTGCGELTSIEFAEDSKIETIEAYAFNSSGLTQITIPNGVTSIDGGTFHKCKSLKKVEIDRKIEEINVLNLFFGCTSLAEIIVDEDNENYFSENGILFNKGKTEIIVYPQGKTDTNYIIPDTVINIRNYAFSECSNLNNITIPNGVTSIGINAFYECSSLNNITIPSSITSIGNSAFSNCSSLVEVNIEGGHIHTEDCVHHCIEGECYEYIWEPCGLCGGNGYINCTGTIYCDSLGFHWCVRDGGGVCNYQEVCPNEDGCTDWANVGSCTEDMECPECGGLGEEECYEEYCDIGDGEYECELVETIEASINRFAFSKCTNLTKITIPNNYTSIDEDAFSGCENLIIYGYAGSKAETYANEHGIDFIIISN